MEFYDCIFNRIILHLIQQINIMNSISSLAIIFFLFQLQLVSQWNPTYIGTNGNGTQIQYLNANYIIASQSETIFVNPEIPTHKYRLVNSIDNGSSWVTRFSHVGNPGQAYFTSNFSFYSSNNGIFAFKTESNQVIKLYKSSNGGNTWSASNIAITESLVPVGISYVSLMDIALILRYGFGYNNHYLYLSSDAGSSWTSQLMPNPKTPRKIHFYKENLGFVVLDSGIVLKSTNKGISWSTITTGYTCNLFDISFRDSLNGIIVGGTSNECYIFKSTNGGETWSLNLNSSITGSLLSVTFKDPTHIYASGKKILGTSNGGSTWIEQAVFPFSASGYISAWNKDTVIAISRDNVFQTSIGIVTGVQQLGSEIHSKNKLSKSFPNPFNSETKIKFNINNKSFVNLVLYDISGKVIAKLVNSFLDSGFYEYTWNATGFASGIYFCRLTMDGFTETQTMILIK